MTFYNVNSNGLPDDLEEIIWLGLMAKYGYTDLEVMKSNFGGSCYLYAAKTSDSEYRIFATEDEFFGKWLAYQPNTSLSFIYGFGATPDEALENHREELKKWEEKENDQRKQ